MSEKDELITVDEAADRFSVSKNSIFRWHREESLPLYRKKGFRQTFVDPSELADFLKPKST